MLKFIVVLAAFVLALTGCSTPTASEPNPGASVAQPVQNSAPTAAKASDSLKKFGEVMTWHDGVSISVSEPTPFVATKSAAGVIDGHTQAVYTLVLTNGTDKPFDPMVKLSASSGGAEARAIFDAGNALGDIGNSPTTVILPGQTVKWLEAYSLADPKAVTVQVSPKFTYDDAIFTNISK